MTASYGSEFLTIKLETLTCTMKAAFLRRPRLIYVSVIAVCRRGNERNESAVRQRTSSVIIHMNSQLSAHSSRETADQKHRVQKSSLLGVISNNTRLNTLTVYF